MVDDHEDYLPGQAPAAHKVSHQSGGADEISVAGLAGEGLVLAAHKILPAIHHVRFTAAEARAAINNIFGADGKADSDIDLDTHKLINVVDPVTDQGGDTRKARNDAISTHAGLATVHQDAPGLIATHAADSALHHVNYTAISAYLSGQQDLVSGVITRVNFDRELYDTQSEWDTFVQRFKATTAGKYLVTFNAHLAETIGLGDEFTMYIIVNAAYSDAVRIIEGGTILAGHSISRVYDFSVDDLVEFRVKMTYTENRKLHTTYTRATITRLL